MFPERINHHWSGVISLCDFQTAQYVYITYEWITSDNRIKHVHYLETCWYEMKNERGIRAPGTYIILTIDMSNNRLYQHTIQIFCGHLWCRSRHYSFVVSHKFAMVSIYTHLKHTHAHRAFIPVCLRLEWLLMFGFGFEKMSVQRKCGACGAGTRITLNIKQLLPGTEENFRGYGMYMLSFLSLSFFKRENINPQMVWDRW